MTDTLEVYVQRAQAGDRDALEQLVRALQTPLYRVCLRMLGEPSLAQDAVQEILILVITRLSEFRGESAITSWAYRIAMRHLLRVRARRRLIRFESLAEHDLAKPANSISPDVLEHAEQRLLEEEIFVGCTQVMLQCLPPTQRAVFVLGAICELEASEASVILGTSEPAFRKRLSRARAELDRFMAAQCGVADANNACRCRYQVNHNVSLGRLNPCRLRFAQPTTRTSLEALGALGEIHALRDALQLYRAQPAFQSPRDHAAQMRRLLDESTYLAPS
jgi:RNA polymerase sigma factor (sigma-70 family)